MSNTTDTPTNLAILPDWNEDVRLIEEFDSNVQRSAGGKTQSSAKRERPLYRLEYIRKGLTETEVRRRLIEIRNEFEKPLMVPIWPDGTILESTMGAATSANLDSNIPTQYEAPFTIYLWNPDLGGEFREVTTKSGRTLTLDGTGTLFPAGSFAFPCKKAIREVDSDALNSFDIKTGTERIRFLTL